MRLYGSIFGKASLVGLAGVLAFSGCSSENGNVGSEGTHNPSAARGSVGLALQLADGSDVESVNYTVKLNGAVVRTGVLAIGADGKASGLITDLDAGAGYEIDLVAPRTRGDAGVEDCTGSATFTVVADVTTPVSVILQCSDTSEGKGNITINGSFNICPKPGIATASPSVQNVGSSIALNATATDKDGDALTYTWFTGATYSAANVFATTAAASFDCTTAGTFTINFAAYDGDTRGCRAAAKTAMTVTCVDTSTVDSGVAVDSGTAEVDSGTAEVDSGTAAVDSGTAAVDSGTTEVDSGTTAVDSGTAAVDSGTGATWPIGKSAACTECQTTQCVDYFGENPFDACSDSLCREVFACTYNNHCFTNLQNIPDCYCGTGIGVSECQAATYVPTGVCKDIIQQGLEATTNQAVLERYINPVYAAGRAGQLETCIADLCVTQCL